jgi:dCMP deaminase
MKFNTSRPTMFDTFAVIVTALGERSTCSSRAKVGALLYDDDNRIIATGYNGAPFGFPHCDDVGCNLDNDNHCKNAIHAEENALLQCAVIGRSTRGLRCFTTHSPCWRCALRLIQAGIVEVNYIMPYGREVDQILTMLHDHKVLVSVYGEV